MPAPGGILLAVGAAPGGTCEAAAYRRAHPDVRVCACNAAIVGWPCDLEFAVSLHARFLGVVAPAGFDAPWLTSRERAGFDAPGCVASSRAEAGVDMVLTSNGPVGGSGMLMVLLGHYLGCERIVLAGVALSKPGYMDAFFNRWRMARTAGLLDNVRCLTPGPIRDLVGGI